MKLIQWDQVTVMQKWMISDLNRTPLQVQEGEAVEGGNKEAHRHRDHLEQEEDVDPEGDEGAEEAGELQIRTHS